MAIVASNISTTSGAISSGAATTVTTSVGNLSVVAVFELSTSSAVSSITDNKSNTYYLAIVHSDASTGGTEIWYAPNATTGITSITINFSAGTAQATFYDCSGAGSNPLVNSNFVQSAHGPGVSTTNPVGPQVNYNVTGGLVISAIEFNATSISSIASPFTLDGNYSGVGGSAHYAYSSGGVFAPSWTLAATSVWSGVSAVFTPGSSTNIRFAEAKNSAGTASALTTSPLTTSVGDLVVIFDCEDSTSSSPIFSDSKGNTFINIAGMNPYNGSAGNIYASYCVLTTAGTNHTFTFNVSGSNGFGPVFVVIVTPSGTPTFNAHGVGGTASNVTNFTNASCNPASADLLFACVGMGGAGFLETGWTVGGSWSLGNFELDGTSYNNAAAVEYQLSAAGGATTDNFTVAANAGSSSEVIFSFTLPGVVTAIYPADMTPGTNVVFEIG